MINWDKVWSKDMTTFGVDFDSYGFRQSVLNAFPDFTLEFEGRLGFMYLDNAGPPGPYVTTGIGNLIDPISMAIDLPWRHKADGTPATQAEIIAAWNTVKSRTDLAPKGGGAFANVTDLTLSTQDVNNLVQSKMLQDEKFLIAKYTNLKDWPADAQMGLMSMTWAMGPSFNFPQFKAATDKLDFTTADKESVYKGAGSAPRIADNHKLFQNAAYVIAHNLDRDKIWYPGTPSGSGGDSGLIPGLTAKNASIIFPILAIGGIGILVFTNRISISKFSQRLDKKVIA